MKKLIWLNFVIDTSRHFYPQKLDVLDLNGNLAGKQKNEPIRNQQRHS